MSSRGTVLNVGHFYLQERETHSKLLKFGCRTVLQEAQAKLKHWLPRKAHEDSKESLSYLLQYQLACFMVPLLQLPLNLCSEGHYISKFSRKYLTNASLANFILKNILKG